jgi:putative NADH-flavin reductase
MAHRLKAECVSAIVVLAGDCILDGPYKYLRRRSVKLFLVGATGRTGKLVLEKAVARGHEVTAFVRRPRSLDKLPEVAIVEGDPANPSALAESLPGHDVVVSTLGRQSKADGMVLRDSAAAMLSALPASQVKRYILVSQGLLFPSRNPLIWLLRRALASTVADSTAMEELVHQADLDWTIVRPPRLKHGDVERGYRACRSARPKGALSMDRSDLAAFLLDEAERGQFPRSIVGVG